MQRIALRKAGLGCGLALLCAGLAGCSTKAKNYTFTDAHGSVRTLADYQGHVVVMGFSNTWCEPCQDAALEMQALQDRFADAGVKVMTVSSWERGDAEAYMEDHGYNYGLMLHGTDIAREYDVSRVPTFFVVGTNGRVIYRHDGYHDDTMDKIGNVVEKHLKRHGNTMVAGHP